MKQAYGEEEEKKVAELNINVFVCFRFDNVRRWTLIIKCLSSNTVCILCGGS